MYRLSNNIEIYTRCQDPNVTILQRGTGRVLKFECDPFSLNLLGQFSRPWVHSSEISSDQEQALASLLQLGVITSEPYPDENHPFRSQLQAFAEWGIDAHEALAKVQNTPIAVVGCGGTGGWLTLQLSAMGFSKFTLIDPDIVDETNLVRQIYDQRHIGRPKVEALKEILHDRRSETKVTTHSERLTQTSDFDAILGVADLVCVAADFPSRAILGSWISSWALARKKTHFICGGYSGHASALGLTVIPGQTPCWLCYEKWYGQRYGAEIPPFEPLKGRVNTAAVVPMVLIASALNALDILRVTVGLKPLLVGARLDLIPTERSFRAQNFTIDPLCPHCREIKNESP